MYNKTNIMGAIPFVKKIVSLNPDKFKFVSLEWAFDSYSVYLLKCKGGTAKSFRQWLKTEI